MKRKLALLLAAVMVIAALPMNVFAATGNSISPQTNAENKTLFFERGIVGANNNMSGEQVNKANNDIKFWVEGTDLRIIFTGEVRKGAKVNLTLENAEWYFRHNGTYTVGGATGFKYNLVNSTLEREIDVTEIAVIPAVPGAIFGFSTGEVAGSLSDAAALAYLTGANAPTLVISDFEDLVVDEEDANALDLVVDYTTAAAGTVGVSNPIPGAALTALPATAIDTTFQATNPSAGNLAYYDLSGVDSAAVLAALIADLSGTVKNVEITHAEIGSTNTYNLTVAIKGSATATPVVDVDYVYAIVAAASQGPTGTYVGRNFPNNLEFKGYTFPGTTGTAGVPNGGAVDNTGGATYNTTIGLMNYSQYSSGANSGAHYVYTRFENTVTPVKNGIDSGDWIPYTLTVMTQGDNKLASIEITEDAVAGDGIRVPLVIRTTADGDYRVRVEAVNTTGIANGNLLIGAKIEGKTKGYSDSVSIKRNEIILSKFRLQEVKPSSIQSDTDWWFELRAPRGYEFSSTKIVAGNSQTEDDAIKNGEMMAFYTEGGLTWKGGTSGSMPQDMWDVTANQITARYKYSNVASRDVDYSIIEFKVPGGLLNKSVATLGALYIRGLSLVPEDQDSIPFGKEIFMGIRNVGTPEVLTEEDVRIGIPLDYDITLTRTKAEIPELISGRYEGGVTVVTNATTGAVTYNDNIEDSAHKAAKVKFAEVVVDAWWAQRNTEFTLPEEVRFLKVRFDNNTVRDSKLTSVAQTRLMTGSMENDNGIYYNARKRFGGVTINDNKMTLTNLAVTANEKASFEFDIWLSIQVDFGGDVELTLDRKALQYCDRDDNIVCVIAKAIVPITVETTVTEAKVGYQYVAVADFVITENVAGALVEGRTANITVTDEITIDMAIANTFVWDLEEGNIRVKDVTTRSILGLGGGAGARSGNDIHIEFYVQRESTVASALSFKNLEVKIDRYVPFSNTSHLEDRGIDLYVWGPAVARNYIYLHTEPGARTVANNYNANDFFTVAGISTKYVNIATLATDSNQAGFVNHVIVTIDSTAYTINGVAAELEVAPYISPESNSTMVPVRFIANALGLPDNAVSWDPATRTATVDANNRIIQFQVGSTYYTVNGTPVPMVSPDGLPVAMEITGDRAFVPFRALGDAFNIPVNWIPETNSAEYNRPVMQ